MKPLFSNRQEAGRLLAIKLTNYANRQDVLVLGLPRGGIPVAFEIAHALHVPLDICVVRKLGVPRRKELAMGAIASGQIKIINQDVVNWLNITAESIEEVAAEELQELKRRELVYRGNRPYPIIKDQTIIIVDDGIATGSTMQAAIIALKKQQPKAIVVATPVAPPSVCDDLKREVEQVVCLLKPPELHSISLWYEDFTQTTDEEVSQLLNEIKLESPL